MSAISAAHTIVAQPSLVGMRACRWAGYGYWYWFSRGAPGGPAKMA
ncbi:hypothetical protein [Modicisalibacter luteus]|uniref:Uncharacterized protein n=1 Tax=Modicisalibacter luteus TaxID=453962 RepID=A0ABV7LY95_9GAMM|nr:hypothetical protein [Halomonas lutea]